MRASLLILAILNFSVAFLMPAFSLGFYGETIANWSVKRHELIDAGALVEYPEAVGVTDDKRSTDWWLMRELLPDYDDRIHSATKPISIVFIVQGIFLLILSARDARATRVVTDLDTNSPSDGPT